MNIFLFRKNNGGAFARMMSEELMRKIIKLILNVFIFVMQEDFRRTLYHNLHLYLISS